MNLQEYEQPFLVDARRCGEFMSPLYAVLSCSLNRVVTHVEISLSNKRRDIRLIKWRECLT